MEEKFGILENGMRYAYKRVESTVACLGVIVGSGSRDEKIPFSGVAHMLEHMLFKGTQRKKYMELMEMVEGCGGEFNAYTSKEDTVFHIAIHRDFFLNAVEVLGDVVSHSLLSPEELKKEKLVVLDEMGFYEDSPSELIFDDFEENFFKGKDLSNTILGRKPLLKKITQEDLMIFYHDNYVTQNMIVSYVGSLDEHIVRELLNKHFNDVRKGSVPSRNTLIEGEQFEKKMKKNTFQTHVVIGSNAYDLYNPKKYALFLLNNFLGGGSFNSILNLKLREENGLTYNIESSYNSFVDAGVFNVYFGVDKKKTEKCIQIINDIFKSLCENEYDSDKLEKYKIQLIGSLSLSYDSKINSMIKNAKNVLYYNSIITFNDIKEQIEAINVKQILEVSNDILNINKLSYLYYD